MRGSRRAGRRHGRTALTVAAVLTLAAGCGEEEPDVREAQTRMEREMRSLVTDLAGEDAELTEEVDRDPSPCGGLEGADWGRVLTAYEVGAQSPQDPATLLPRAQELLDELGVGFAGGTGGATLLTVDGEGYVGSLAYDEEAGRLRFTGETECLDNPDR